MLHVERCCLIPIYISPALHLEYSMDRSCGTIEVAGHSLSHFLYDQQLGPNNQYIVRLAPVRQLTIRWHIFPFDKQWALTTNVSFA